MKRNQHIADLAPVLAGQKIHHVIICPGSRNAPLIQLFTSDPSFRCHSIVDERSAGYVALGMARQLQEPVAVVTTSGTAVLNLAPAAAEAHFQHVPLVLVTADRPRESVPQFDNQVIDQQEPFIRNSKGFFQFPAGAGNEGQLQEIGGHVQTLVREACSFPEGPVHFNVPLEEPLYEPLPPPRENQPPSGENLPKQGKNHPVKKSSRNRWKRISSGTRLLVLAGAGRHGGEIPALLESMARKYGTVVVAENIANLPSDRFIANPELLLNAAGEKELKELTPERLVVFGGQVVSKRMKLFLKAHPPGEIVLLENDPEGGLRTLLETLEGSAKRTDDEEDGRFGGYPEAWKRLEGKALAQAVDFLERTPFSNLAVIHRTMSSLPAGTVLHLGNSSVIRYSQLLPMRKDLQYFSNRGTSGIDGVVSTAVGAAMVSAGQHLLLVGDLSFVYDSNALWNKDFPANLKIVVVNDGGGGIFRLLEGPDRMPFFEEYSVTRHPVSLELLSRSFGREHLKADGLDELEEKLNLLLAPDSGINVLEADTSGSENSRIFKSFLNHHHSSYGEKKLEDHQGV